MSSWSHVVMLSAGGALGVNARYWLGLWINRVTGPEFPWATFAINVSGSFAIGFLTVALARWLPHPNVRLLVVVGFLGGYTTFSTFEYDSLTLWERGEWRFSLANMAGSVMAGFLAVVLGVGLGRAVTAPRFERAAPRVSRDLTLPLQQPGSPETPPLDGDPAPKDLERDANWRSP